MPKDIFFASKVQPERKMSGTYNQLSKNTKKIIGHLEMLAVQKIKCPLITVGDIRTQANHVCVGISKQGGFYLVELLTSHLFLWDSVFFLGNWLPRQSLNGQTILLSTPRLDREVRDSCVS